MKWKDRKRLIQILEDIEDFSFSRKETVIPGWSGMIAASSECNRLALDGLDILNKRRMR